MPNEKEAEILLKVDHLCQYFKTGSGTTKAVDDVSFDVKKGEVFGLVGESGCGKTTTGRSIIKLYDITSGNIYFKGRRICAGTLSYREAIKNAKMAYEEAAAKLRTEGGADVAVKLKAEQEKFEAIRDEQLKNIKTARYDHKHSDDRYVSELIAEIDQKYSELLKNADGDEKSKLTQAYKAERKAAKKQKLITQIQMIFQDPVASLDPRMTVREIISEGLAIRGIKDKEEINRRVFEVLERVGLVQEHAGRYPHEFSGGQKQRIGVARSVIMNPEFIIADEPVSALDVSIQAQVINLLNDVRRDMGLTILFIAHDLSVVKYFSDRIGVMYMGKMVELADSDELFRHPLHPYTKSLLSAIPLPDPNYEKQRKRIVYQPLAEHDYSVEKPAMREVISGHFVYCNEPEYQKYCKLLREER